MRTVSGHSLQINVIKWTLVSSLFVVLAACGGGGGSSPAAPEVTPPPPATTPTTPGTTPTTPPTPPPTIPPVVNPPSTQQPVINSGIAGKLYMSGPGTFIEFDLPTGISRIMRAKGGVFSPSLDGAEFVLANRFVAGQAASVDDEEIAFFNRDGRSSNRFLKLNGFSGTPILSPDKQYVLVEWSAIDNGDAGGVLVPTVFKRDGTVVRRFTNYTNIYAWFPNGTILLARGDSLYRASATGNAAPTLIARIPNETPRAVTLSPDGNRIAFTIGNFTILENSTWIINVDGTGLRQVAKSTAGGVAPHSFSPDGSQLLLSEGSNYAAIGPGYAFAGCAELYVVPLNLAAPLALNAQSPAPATKLRSVFEDSGDVSPKACAFSTAFWRAMPELPPYTAGTVAAGSGLNRGLNGRAWYGFAGDLFRSDLSTGITAKLGRGPNSPHVSFDGTEVVVTDRFAANLQLSYEALMIFDSTTGAQKSRLDYPEGFGAVVKLSPDKAKLASDYVNLDEGDPGGAYIVTVFSRDLKSRIVRWNGARSFDWMPDGRLLLGSLQQIAVTSADLQSVTSIISLPDPISGLNVSRDGTRIAFIMNGNIWVVGIDGQGLKQLTETGRLLSTPQFSPDGRYVLADSSESPYQTWVVPADGIRVPVQNTGIKNTSAFPLRIVENGEVRLMYPSSSVNWR